MHAAATYKSTMRTPKTHSEIRGTSVLIAGYGREGKSVHAWVKSQYPAVRVGIADTRELTQEEISGAALFTGADYLSHLSEYDTVIRSPGISPFAPKIASYLARGGYMTSATNIFFSLCPGMVVGVTGTKGKSTTASLIAHILSRRFPDVRLVGNIGVPMLDCLAGATPKTVFVSELSSHQLYDIRYSPHVAVFLPMAPEHQDYYPDIKTYAEAKTHIAAYQGADDVLVYDGSNQEIVDLLRNFPAQRRLYASSPETTEAVRFEGDALAVRDTVVVKREEISLRGNNHPILAASAVSDVLGVSADVLAAALRTFAPLPHRLELVGEYNGVRYVNDSLATIPEACVHALDALGTDVATLIAGGYSRGLSQEVLALRLVHSHVKSLILFPDTGEQLRAALQAADPKSPIQTHAVYSMEDAVRLAVSLTPKGKICLLSPAAASFNLFRDYKDRGEQFAMWVKKLGGIPH